MRKTLIIGNWKMNNGPQEGLQFMGELYDRVKKEPTDTEWAIAAPFITLPYMLPQEEASDGKIILPPLAAQNVHFEDNGAFTGEISIPMLEQLHVKYVIIGHSERREMFNETNETVNKKVLRTLKSNIIPVVAYGETLEQFEEGVTKNVITTQIKEALKDVNPLDMEKVVLAYEPIWAIGTGKTATPEQAQDMCKASRDIVTELFGDEVASKVRILYGGSMNPGNVKELIAQEDIDGGLVGGASLEVDSFMALINYDKE